MIVATYILTVYGLVTAESAAGKAYYGVGLFVLAVCFDIIKDSRRKIKAAGQPPK